MRPQKDLFACCILLLLCLAPFGWAARVLEPAEARYDFEAPPVEWYMRNQPEIVGYLVIYICILKIIDREDILKVTNFGPYIAFTNVSGDTITYFRRLQDTGAIGVLLGDGISEFAGTYDLPNVSFNRSLLWIPIVQIGSKDTKILKDLISQYKNVTITMAGPIIDRNYWKEVRQSPVLIAVQLVMSLFSGTAAAFGLAKLFGYIVVRGIRFEVPHVCLFCVFAANFIRLIFYSLDPNFIIRNVFSYAASNFLLSIPHVFYVASQLALALYWTELITNVSSAVVSLELTKLKWPFIGITIVVLILDMVAVILRALDQDATFAVLISAVIAAIVAVASSGFFSFTSYRVISTLRRSSGTQHEIKSSSKRVAQKTLRLVIVTIVCSLLFVVTAILIVIDSIFYQPIAFYTLLTLKDVWLTSVSISQAAMFKTMRRGTSSSISTKS